MMDQNISVENTPLPEEKEKSKKKLFLIIGGIFIMLLIIAVAIFFLLRNTNEEEIPDEVEQTTQSEEQIEPTLVWSVESEEKLNSLAVSPDGQSIAVGEYLKASIYNLEDGEFQKEIEYKHSVDDLEFSNDSKILAGGQGVNGTLLNDIETGLEVKSLHGGYNNYLAFSPDGNNIATGNREGIIWIWDLQSYEMIKELEEEDPTWIKSVVYHPDGNLLAVTHWGSTSGNPYINIWDIEEEEIIDRIDLTVTVGSVVNLVKYSPSGDLLAIADRNDEWEYFVNLLDVESGEEVLKIDIEKNQYDLDFSPDGTMIAVGVQAAPVKIFNVETGKLLYTFNQTGFETGESNWIQAISFAPDSNHVAVTRADNSLELWRLSEVESVETE
jgi:WD40 repeat protein